MEIKILAKSSSHPEPYLVIIKWNGSKISAFCNCRAGELGQLCKHKLQILSCDSKVLFDVKQVDDLNKIAEWVNSSTLLKVFDELEKAEQEKEKIINEAKKRYSAIKHKIERLLIDGV